MRGINIYTRHVSRCHSNHGAGQVGRGSEWAAVARWVHVVVVYTGLSVCVHHLSSWIVVLWPWRRRRTRADGRLNMGVYHFVLDITKGDSLDITS